MRHELPKNLLHNPFHNRFNVPVTQRRDSLQAHANVVWLHQHQDPSLGGAMVAPVIDNQTPASGKAHDAMTVFGEVAALIVVLISMLVLLRVF